MLFGLTKSEWRDCKIALAYFTFMFLAGIGIGFLTKLLTIEADPASLISFCILLIIPFFLLGIEGKVTKILFIPIISFFIFKFGIETVNLVF